VNKSALGYIIHVNALRAADLTRVPELLTLSGFGNGPPRGLKEESVLRTKQRRGKASTISSMRLPNDRALKAIPFSFKVSFPAGRYEKRSLYSLAEISGVFWMARRGHLLLPSKK